MERYLEHVFTFLPEERVALGAPGPYTLRDPSPEGFLAERDATRALLDALDRDAGDDDLDARWARRALSFRLRTIERGHAQRNLELAMLPHAVVQYQLARGADPGALAREIPRFLERFTQTLAREEGPRDAAVIEGFVEAVLPEARGALEAMGEGDAADAYDRFRDVVARLTPGPAPLGEDEVRWRLEAFGLREDADALEAAAKAELDALAIEAASVCAELGVALSPGLVGTFDAMLDDVGAALARSSARAVTFLRDHALFVLPDAFTVPLVPAPEAMVHGNWPCPLLDPDADGAVLVPRAWPAFWADVYAVHEGAPGHYLQSWSWQRTKQPPSRHVGVADDLAFATHDYGPMLGIEGWAVYAEELMRRNGFFEGPSRLAVLVSHAVRAVRVLVDLGLQRGTLSDADAVRLYTDRAWMPEGWAKNQLVRHRRLPLQGLTYFAGRFAIEALEARSDRKGHDFRAWLLEQGPIAPSLLDPVTS